MADEVEIAKNSLDVLSGVFAVSSTLATVSTIIKASGALASAFPAVGALLALIGALLPDVKHKEIISRLKDLSRKIDMVRGDIQDLKHEISWEITELQYGAAMDRLELGIEYCLEMGNATGKNEKMIHQKKLAALCANEYCAVSLTTLFNGVTGKGSFRSSSILEKFADKTGGDRKRISALATKLLRVLCSGMVVLSTYETMMHGKKGAEVVTKRFYVLLNEASGKVQSVLNRCEKNFHGYMLNDLNKILDEGGTNKGLLTKITNFMTRKYYWLENFVLVYNDLRGIDKHCFNGNRVESLHRNGKCAIVFYRTKGEPPRFSNRYDEAKKIVGNVYNCAHAQRCYSDIVSTINQRRIGWSGCAVISRFPDLCVGGNFTTKIVHIVKYRIEVGRFDLIKRSVKSGEAILLMK